MENNGQRSRKLVKSPNSPFTIYGSLAQPSVLGNQEANDRRGSTCVSGSTCFTLGGPGSNTSITGFILQKELGQSLNILEYRVLNAFCISITDSCLLSLQEPLKLLNLIFLQKYDKDQFSGNIHIARCPEALFLILILRIIESQTLLCCS